MIPQEILFHSHMLFHEHINLSCHVPTGERDGEDSSAGELGF